MGIAAGDDINMHQGIGRDKSADQKEMDRRRKLVSDKALSADSPNPSVMEGAGAATRQANSGNHQP